MNAFDSIGTALARARAALLKSLGVTVTFSHRGAAGVALRAGIVSESTEGAASPGHFAEERVLELLVPAGQAGFAAPTGDAEPVVPGDSVQYRARTYHVAAPIAKDRYGRLYRLRCVERKRLGGGLL
ncbi:MAG: hypothetical protein L6R28_01620 [Planctomycetes bacterium]|nr:hypothetical protein [Planctomycetota bacterium]